MCIWLIGTGTSLCVCIQFVRYSSPSYNVLYVCDLFSVVHRSSKHGTIDCLHKIIQAHGHLKSHWLSWTILNPCWWTYDVYFVYRQSVLYPVRRAATLEQCQYRLRQVCVALYVVYSKFVVYEFLRVFCICIIFYNTLSLSLSLSLSLHNFVLFFVLFLTQHCSFQLHNLVCTCKKLF